MPLIDDIAIDTTNQRVNLTANTFYQSRELYSLLMDLFDESGAVTLPGAMTLPVPMSAQTPTDYTAINGWYFTQQLMRYLTGGSVQTSGYNNVVRLLSFNAAGYTAAVPGDIGRTVTASGGNTGVLLDYDNTSRKWWVRSLTSWGNSMAVSITGGTGAGTTTSSGAATGEEAFSNLFTIGSIISGNSYFTVGSQLFDGNGWYGVGNSNGNSSIGFNGHLDILVKIREAGQLLGGGSATVFNRANRSATGGSTGSTYDWTTVDLTGLGRNTVALATSTDTNDTLSDAAIAAFVASGLGGTGATAQIAIAFGTYNADIDANGTNETYSVRVDCSGQPLSIVYQALKYITRKTSTANLNGVQGQIYRFANAAYTPVKAAPFGTFAGGKFFGAQGVHLINVPGADASNYELVDNAGNRVVPPTFVPVAITGLVAGDRVLVARTAAGAIDKSYLTLAAGNNLGGSTLVMSNAIPADTPSSGAIRVVHAATATEQRYQYSSYNAATRTFTLTGGTLDRNYASGNTAYVPYLDGVAAGAVLSVGVQYASDRAVRANVRNGSGVNKIIPFAVDGTLGNAGFSVPATRTPDTINTNP